ncbi:SRPBCC family protein [Micromonospora sp. NPDC005237]|uniref:SRPBCC family protein n=1 Tax=Micromonospora sp. NPDC005237 TaxID=3155113 RepID=UPI0033B830C1
MRGSSSRAHGAVEARVTIRRPVREVFAFYRDFTSLPRFLGDVLAIEQVGPRMSRWTIQGPLGVRLTSTMEVTEERANEVIRYETRSLSGLRTYWEVHFTGGPTADETEVREVMRTPLGRLGHAALALMGKPPAGEVPANLRRLKEVLETGRVTSMEHAVAGKFS